MPPLLVHRFTHDVLLPFAALEQEHAARADEKAEAERATRRGEDERDAPAARDQAKGYGRERAAEVRGGGVDTDGRTAHRPCRALREIRLPGDEIGAERQTLPGKQERQREARMCQGDAE